jgi:hypothetical protein
MSKRSRSSTRVPYHDPCVTLYYMELTTAMLADGAHAAQGKLYVLGGQWDRLLVSQFPARHPSMSVVLVIKIDYSEAPKECPITVELMLDGQPVGAKATGALSIGHAPGLKRGAPQFAPTAIPFNDLQFEKPGRYEWVISSGSAVLGQIPLEVVQIVTVQPGQGAEPRSQAE